MHSKSVCVFWQISEYLTMYEGGSLQFLANSMLVKAQLCLFSVLVFSGQKFFKFVSSSSHQRHFSSSFYHVSLISMPSQHSEQLSPFYYFFFVYSYSCSCLSCGLVTEMQNAAY